MENLKRYLVATAIIPVLLWVGCGADSTRYTCEPIEHQGRVYSCEQQAAYWERVGRWAEQTKKEAQQIQRELSK